MFVQVDLLVVLLKRNVHDQKHQQTIECDDIVVNGGMKPNHETAVSFAGSAKEYYSIGNCRQPGNMRLAIRDAYAVAMQI